jgi:integrase
MWLSHLKPGYKAEYSDTETQGLRLRVWSSGFSWCFVYRVPGSRAVRRVTLGTYPEMSLADARKAARELRTKVDKGNDPGAEIQERKKIPTFAELSAEYLEKHAIHKRTRDEDERIINRELLPRWGSTRADKITRRDVIALLDTIQGRGAPIMANRTLALVRKIFNWALSRDILDATPCLRLKAPAPEKNRDRWLDDQEIRAVWEAFESELKSGALFKLLLLTGQRRGEVCAMRWDEIDLSTALWTIPPEKTKNGVRHVVPLSPPVVEILQGMPRKSEWVFPSPCLRCGHVQNLGKAHQRVQELAGVRFHIHDLRRTAATGMARLGVDRVVIAKVLNHADPSVTAIYERHTYEQEKRRGLEKWAAHVMRLLNRETASVITYPRPYPRHEEQGGG